MSRTQRGVLLAVFGAAALLRLHAAWAAHPLSGFDGPYHAAYIGILHYEGRIPLADESWSTFHPPLYYLLCAGVWELMPAGAGARAVLFALRGVGVLFGLALGLAVTLVARRLFPGRPWVAIQSAAVALFLPMHVASSSLIGNEVPAAALSGFGLLWLLRASAEPTPRAAAGVGAVLGLAVLTKFSAFTVLAAAGVVLAARGVSRAGWSPAALAPAAAFGAAFLVVTAPYFGRNWVHHGTPILTEVELSADVMERQGYRGQRRPLAGYLEPWSRVLLDPADRSPRAQRGVWPVTFASVWYDLHGTLVYVQSPWGQRFGPILCGFGALLSGFAILGMARVARRGVEAHVPLARTALLLVVGLGLASYAAFTWRTPTFSALKGSFLSQTVVPFALFTGLGLDAAGRTRRSAAALRALVAAFALAVGAIFWVGWLAPIPMAPAVFYRKAYSDPATERVFDYFVRGEPPAPAEAGRGP